MDKTKGVKGVLDLLCQRSAQFLPPCCLAPIPASKLYWHWSQEARCSASLLPIGHSCLWNCQHGLLWVAYKRSVQNAQLTVLRKRFAPDSHHKVLRSSATWQGSELARSGNTESVSGNLKMKLLSSAAPFKLIFHIRCQQKWSDSPWDAFKIISTITQKTIWITGVGGGNK